MASGSHFEFLANMMKLGDYSDFTPRCNGEEMPVHKNVVCAQSPVLVAAIRGDFKEAKTNAIDVDFDVGTCKRMITFMYTGNYEGDSTADSKLLKTEGGGPFSSLPLDTQTVDTHPLLCHLRVNSIADYYEIPALFLLWSATAFTEVLREAFTTTGDRQLFDMVASLVAQHLEELTAFEDFGKLDLPSRFTQSVMRNSAKRLQDSSTRTTQAAGATSFKFRRP
ncbi:Uu.00g128520.m01.CDS01 [Anthostomella pinea]|uniref:Uu.00g128520.m01.CDS01 n=1 Tax=Anthostomella pinea TaxID=933095 RepID=A0AAI8YFK5_9PEZI|nr:Uu.00g128520.m01.CDS01 [Anthostomella pinea]